MALRPGVGLLHNTGTLMFQFLFQVCFQEKDLPQCPGEQSLELSTTES